MKRSHERLSETTIEPEVKRKAKKRNNQRKPFLRECMAHESIYSEEDGESENYNEDEESVRDNEERESSSDEEMAESHNDDKKEVSNKTVEDKESHNDDEEDKFHSDDAEERSYEVEKKSYKTEDNEKSHRDDEDEKALRDDTEESQSGEEEESQSNDGEESEDNDEGEESQSNNGEESEDDDEEEESQSDDKEESQSNKEEYSQDDDEKEEDYNSDDDEKLQQPDRVKKEEEFLSLEDFEALLEVMKVKLPNETLNEEVIKFSRSLGKQATTFAQDLRKSKLKFHPNPSLGSREIKSALLLKKKENIQGLTKIIFTVKTKKNFENWWKSIKAKSKCSFNLKDTFKEPFRPDKKTSGRKVTDHSKNKKNEEECFEFYLKQKGAQPDQYAREKKVKFGFFSGKPDYVAEFKPSSDKNNKPSTETVIIECKGTENNTVRSMFNKPDEPKVDLNKSHQYYYQTLSYLYMLRKTNPNPESVQAVMVICNQSDSEFCYGDVNNDIKDIEDLDLYLQREVLALFLAVLNVIFQKGQT